MAVIFLLGPGYWDPAKGIPPSDTPLKVRERLAAIFERDGHAVIIMEKASVIKGEGMIEKFDRLLHQAVTDVVIYWPPLSKMQTTYDEFILLYERREFLRKKRIGVTVLYHPSVSSIGKDEFDVLEKGNRSRYLTDLVRLGVDALEWEDDEDLDEQAKLLSTQLRS